MELIVYFIVFFPVCFCFVPKEKKKDILKIKTRINIYNLSNRFLALCPVHRGDKNKKPTYVHCTYIYRVLEIKWEMKL